MAFLAVPPVVVFDSSLPSVIVYASRDQDWESVYGKASDAVEKVAPEHLRGSLRLIRREGVLVDSLLLRKGLVAPPQVIDLGARHITETRN